MVGKAWYHLRMANRTISLVRRAQSRTTLLTLGATVLVSVALVAIFQNVLKHPFHELEKRLAEQDAVRIQEAWSGATDAMARVTWEYALWNDTYEWVQGRKPDYLDINFTPSILREMGYDLVVVLDKEGQIFWASTRNRRTGDSINLVEFAEKIPVQSVLRMEHESVSAFADMKQGYVELSGQLYAMALCPIIPTGGGSDPAGTFWIAQRVDNVFLANLGQKTNLPLEINHSPAVMVLSNQIHVAIDERVKIRVPIPLLDGGRGGFLEVVRTPAIIQEGKQAVYMTLGLTWGAILAVMMLVLFGIRRILLEPLELLQNRIRAIRQSGDLHGRIETRGDDEMASIAGSFNAMAAQLQDSKKRIEELSRTDQLTRLPNRKDIFEFLDKQAEKSLRESMPVALLLLDVDHLRILNERGGTRLGDEALGEVAQCLQRELRLMDRVGRVAGDEFLAVLPGMTREIAAKLGETVRQSINALQLGNPPVPFTVTIGVCRLDPNNPGESIGDAEQLLQTGKSTGGNTVITTV